MQTGIQIETTIPASAGMTEEGILINRIGAENVLEQNPKRDTALQFIYQYGRHVSDPSPDVAHHR